MSVVLGSNDLDSLRARLDELEAAVPILEAEVRNLRGERSQRRGRVGRKQSMELGEASEAVSRRRMLGMLKGAAAAGAGLAVIGTSKQAYADAIGLGTADLHALQIGGANTNSAGTTSLTGSLPSDAAMFRARHNGSSGGPDALVGGQGSSSSGVTGGSGVFGFAFAAAASGVRGFHVNAGVGVLGASNAGPAVRVADRVDGFGGPPTIPMPPTTGTWATGSLVNSAGQLWYCYLAGVGSASKWARLSSTFVPLTPTRVYDSRVGAPLPTGILSAGANRLISVADGRDGAGAVATANLVPAGATAVTANVTVTGTASGFGYLAINPGGNTVEGASTINWSAAGQTLANGVTLTLNASRQLTVICNGIAGASTHFIVDVSGYYL